MCAIGYLVVTVVVFLHPVNRVDRYLENIFRPGDEWGDPQLRADFVVEGLRPAVSAIALAGATVVLAIRRRSIWPLAFSLGLGSAAAASSMATKIMLARPDPHGAVSPYSGSYPSGHTLTVLICAGAVVLLWTDRTRWWAWCLVGAITTVMAYALLLQATHWATDVLGSVLLGTALLLAASSTTWRYRAAGSEDRGDHRPP